MSLKEKLQKIEPVFVSDDDYKYRILDDLTDSTLDEYINKILDAAGKACNSVKTIADDEKGIYVDDVTVDHCIKAINKLRQEK